MSVENLLWGAPRIHGELLKLGFAVAQSTVASGPGQSSRSPQGSRRVRLRDPGLQSHPDTKASGGRIMIRRAQQPFP
jgi:hypothetical protein